MSKDEFESVKKEEKRLKVSTLPEEYEEYLKQFNEEFNNDT